MQQKAIFIFSFFISTYLNFGSTNPLDKDSSETAPKVAEVKNGTNFIDAANLNIGKKNGEIFQIEEKVDHLVKKRAPYYYSGYLSYDPVNDTYTYTEWNYCYWYLYLTKSFCDKYYPGSSTITVRVTTPPATTSYEDFLYCYYVLFYSYNYCYYDFNPNSTTTARTTTKSSSINNSSTTITTASITTSKISTVSVTTEAPFLFDLWPSSATVPTTKVSTTATTFRPSTYMSTYSTVTTTTQAPNFLQSILSIPTNIVSSIGKFLSNVPYAIGSFVQSVVGAIASIMG